MSKPEILNLEYQLIDAIKHTNIGFLEKHLHNDLLFITPNGQTITKEIDIMSHRSGQMKVEWIEASFEDLQLINDLAIVVVTYQTKGTMLGKPINGTFKYIRFWKLIQNDFMIIGGSCHQIE